MKAFNKAAISPTREEREADKKEMVSKGGVSSKPPVKKKRQKNVKGGFQ